MTRLWITIVALGLCHAVPVVAGDVGWPALETALQGRQLQVTIPAANPVPFKQGGYPFTLSRRRCPKLPVEAFKAYEVKVQFETKRAYRMNIYVGKLPKGFDVYGAIAAAAPDPAAEDGCELSKSGVSLLQFGEYLLVFPTFCRDVYPYRKSLPIVIEALKKSWGALFPKEFIYAPCGTMFPKRVAVDDYLKGAGPKTSGTAGGTLGPASR